MHDTFNASFTSEEYIISATTVGATGSASNGGNLVYGGRFTLTYYKGGSGYTITNVVITLTSKGYLLAGDVSNITGIRLARFKPR